MSAGAEAFSYAGWVKSLDNSHEEIRLAGLRALANLPTLASLRAVRRLASTDVSSAVRATACAILDTAAEKLATAEPSRDSGDSIVGNGDPAARIRAVRKMAFNLDPRVPIRLTRMLAMESDPAVESVLLQAVAATCGPEILKVLSAYLSSGDARLREAAVEAISALADEAVLPQVLLLLEDPHYRVRAAATRCVKAQNRSVILECIDRMLAQGSVPGARAALYVLRFFDHETALPRLEGRLNGEDEGVRQVALESLRILASKGAIRAARAAATLGDSSLESSSGLRVAPLSPVTELPLLPVEPLMPEPGPLDRSALSRPLQSVSHLELSALRPAVEEPLAPLVPAPAEVAELSRAQAPAALAVPAVPVPPAAPPPVPQAVVSPATSPGPLISPPTVPGIAPSTMPGSVGPAPGTRPGLLVPRTQSLLDRLRPAGLGLLGIALLVLALWILPSLRPVRQNTVTVRPSVLPSVAAGTQLVFTVTPHSPGSVEMPPVAPIAEVSPPEPTLAEMEAAYKAAFAGKGIKSDAIIHLMALDRVSATYRTEIARAYDAARKNQYEAAMAILDNALAQLEQDHLVARLAVMRAMMNVMRICDRFERANEIKKQMSEIQHRLLDICVAAARDGGIPADKIQAMMSRLENKERSQAEVSRGVDWLSGRALKDES